MLTSEEPTLLYEILKESPLAKNAAVGGSSDAIDDDGDTGNESQYTATTVPDGSTMLKLIVSPML